MIFNDWSHIANTNGVCVDMPFHLEDSSNVQTISGMLYQLMDPRGEYFENYKCDGCQRLNTLTKAVYVTQLSGALIIQLKFFEYVEGISKKVILNLSIDEEIMFGGNTMLLSGVIYHEEQQSNYEHCTSGWITSSWVRQ